MLQSKHLVVSLIFQIVVFTSQAQDFSLINRGVLEKIDSSYAFYNCQSPISQDNCCDTFMQNLTNAWSGSDIGFKVTYTHSLLEEYYFKAGINMDEQEYPDLLQGKLCVALKENQAVDITLKLIQLEKYDYLLKNLEFAVWLSDTMVLNSKSLHKANKSKYIKYSNFGNKEGKLNYSLNASGGEQFLIIAFAHPQKRQWGTVRFQAPLLTTNSDNNCSVDIKARTDSNLLVFPSDVLFDFNSDSLIVNLDSLINQLNLGNQGYSRITVLGYTDTIGNESYNLDLSERRARKVSEALKLTKLGHAQIDYQGMGECKEPVKRVEDCRRVEIMLIR